MIDVAYVFSVNYSGSHLLSSLLGSHSHCASVGELRNYRKFSSPGHEHAIVSDFTQNPIFAGLDSIPERDWYTVIQDRVRVKYPSVTMLVDNSKKIHWAQQFTQDFRIRSHYIHLVRDPRALLRRWRNSYDTSRRMRTQRTKLAVRSPLRLPVALFGSDEEVLLSKWLLANKRITRFMQQSGKPFRVITYHDLVTKTVDELAYLMTWLGYEFESEQLSFGAGKNFGTQKAEYVEQSGRSEIKIDLRWQKDLTRQEQNAVTGNEGVRKYLEGIGVAFSDNGLIGCRRD